MTRRLTAAQRKILAKKERDTMVSFSDGEKSALQVMGSLDIQKTPDPSYSRVVHKSQGKTTGIGITAFWVSLFMANERQPVTRKMTDAEILRQLMLEFPDRKSVEKLVEGKTTVNNFRNLYNKGVMTRNVVPTIRSNRYTVLGELAHPRTGRAMLQIEHERHLTKAERIKIRRKRIREIGGT